MQIKVVFISTSLSAGGSERNIVNIIDYLNKKTDIKADLIIIRNKKDFLKQYSGSFISSIKTHIIFPDLTDKYQSLSPTEFLPAIIKTMQIIKKEQYQIVIAADHGVFLTATIVAKILRIKSIVTVINNIQAKLDQTNILFKPFYYFGYALSLFMANGCICISKGLKDQVYGLFHRKNTTLIYRGIDPLYLNKKLKEKVPDKIKSYVKNKEVVVALGRLIKQKGFVELIDIFPLIIKKRPKARLIIVGDGEEKKTLIKKIQAMGLSDKIYLIQDNSNPIKYFKLGKVFVFVSKYEGFGNVLIEAMNASLPIVSVDCCFGPREILSNSSDYSYGSKNQSIYKKYGILIPSIKYLPEAISVLLRNSDMRQKYAQLSKIRAKYFNVRTMVKSYQSIIYKIANE